MSKIVSISDFREEGSLLLSPTLWDETLFVRRSNRKIRCITRCLSVHVIKAIIPQSSPHMSYQMDLSNLPEYLYQRRVYDGMRLPSGIARPAYDSALAYKPRPDDLFVVSFPKSGTTWVQYIVCLIYSEGVPPDGPIMFGATPFLEFVGGEGVLEYEKPIPIKSHLPITHLPFHPVAKYIYVCRNPKDTLVSYYFHIKTETGCPEYVSMTMETFFREFMEGKADWNDYYDHVIGFYQHRHDANVLFLTYEEMKADLRSAVMEIANFMGPEYGKKLHQDKDLLDKIVQEASFRSMKEHINKSLQAAMDGKVRIPAKMRSLMEELKRVPTLQGFADFDFARKGVVGDHVNHLTAEQEEEVNRVSRERLASCPDLLHLWYEQLK